MKKLKDLNSNVPAAIIAAFLCAIVLLLDARYARATEDEWQMKDKVLMGTLVTMQVIDIAQTKKCLRNGGYELNPLYGKHPSDGQLIAGKVLATGLVYYVADRYSDYRTSLLAVANIVQFVVIRHNYVGARVGWGF